MRVRGLLSLENGGGCEPEEAEPELSERELAFIKEMAASMDRYCKPIVNISFKPMTQAVFSAGGRYSTFVLPSPLRAVRILAQDGGLQRVPAEEGPRPALLTGAGELDELGRPEPQPGRPSG